MEVGKITKIIDTDRYVVECELPNHQEVVTCYPLVYLNQPKVDDEVFLYPIGDVYTYLPIRTHKDTIEWIHKGNKIKFNDSKNTDMDLISKSDINIKGKKGINLTSGDDINIQSKSLISLRNEVTSLKRLLIKFTTMYINTKTIKGGPLTKDCILRATDVIGEINKLLK